MIARIIEYSVRNRWLVIMAWLGIALWGVWATLRTPVDAIPDLSENQVIVFADWMGRSPQDIEEQVTYPLSVQLQGLAGVKTVRSSSEPNFSMITIIFDDKTDFYFARNRVLERLTTAKAQLPADVTPVLAPDATALGQVFWYTVEGEGRSLDELRAVQDFVVRYQLASIPGVAEVASVGGFVRQYQVDVDPARLRTWSVDLATVLAAVQSSNLSVGGKTISTENSEYMIRATGWVRGIEDLENVVVETRGGVPIRVKDVATVQLGPEFRRSALEKNGTGEAVGGVVMMRVGENPLEVTRLIKQKIREMQSGLPEGVRVVPFYDRTRLIESAIHTVTRTLKEEIIIATVAIVLILAHLRSALVVCVTLPMAVLISFLLMYYSGIPSNIMSLSGIAISIGILVDAAVVMVENATHELKEHFGDRPVTGDTTEIVVRSCRLVGRPIFFSVVIMLISFLPVFAFGGQEGRLSHPLAYTKSFAMVGVAVLAITFVPAVIPLLVRGRLKREEQNPIVRSFIHIYKPMLSWMIDRPGLVWWMMGAILVLGAGFIHNDWAMRAAVGFGLVAVLLAVRTLRWRGSAAVSLLVIAVVAQSRFGKLGGEFMPELNEGSIMDMPTTAPRIPIAQAVDDVIVRDRLMRSFPEVEQAVGKIGRAETATDPSPLDMVETVVTLKPHEWWPKRRVELADATAQARNAVAALQRGGWLKPGAVADDALIDTATMIAVEQFDRALRDLATRRLAEHGPKVAHGLVATALDALLAHVESLPDAAGKPALMIPLAPEDRSAIIASARHHGEFLSDVPRQEEVDALLRTLVRELTERGCVAPRDDLLLDPPGLLRDVVGAVRGAVGRELPTFAERVMARIEAKRDQLWRERMKTLDWELFDYGKVAINDLLIDALLRTAQGTPFDSGVATDSASRAKLRDELVAGHERGLFLWRKTKDDLVKEMDSELQMPGWGNAWTQPIINRVNMLATGVRTQIGVKVFGPSGKPLEESIREVQRVSERIAERLKEVRGAVDVIADQATGKRYVQIDIDRERAARYGVNVADVAQAVEVAMGGARVTTTVEGRQRFGVQVRYERQHWQDVESLKDVLVTGRTSQVRTTEIEPAGSAGPPAGGEARAARGMGGSGSMPPTAGAMSSGGGAAMAGASGMGASPAPRGGVGGGAAGMGEQSTTLLQVPLRMVADVRVVDGPSMIKSENGRLRNYVTLNVRDRDIVGFVEEARQAIKPIEAELAGTGMSIEWSGEFENQLRARRTLSVIFPMVVALILLLLYMTFHDALDTLLVFLAVFGALAGAVMFQALFGFNFSVIVSIGYIAAFGMATETGVIMLVYLREALDRRGGLAAINSVEELRSAVIEGAVHRLRPKLLTEGVAIVGLVPMLWATGTGAEIMRPMAAPVLGGLLISDEVIDLMIPVLFYWIRRRRWQKMRAGEAARSSTVDSSTVVTGNGPVPALSGATSVNA